MNKNNKMLATVFISSILSGIIFGSGALEIDMKNYEEVINSTVNNIVDDVDAYLVQVLVESRYQTATSVVWVYGCADKT